MSVVYPTSVVTIASGGTVSNAVDLQKGAVVGLLLPALTSASLTFQGCDTLAGTYSAVYTRDGTQYSVTTGVATARYVMIPPADLAGIKFLKVVAAGAEAADRAIVVLVRWV